MKNRKKLLIPACVAVVIACAIGAFLLTRDSNSGSAVLEGFVDNGLGELYSQGVPVDEMDLLTFGKYFGKMYPLPDDGLRYVKTVALPCDVHYYAHPGDWWPVLTLKKGQEVYVLSANGWLDDFVDNYDVGYGPRCWPDYRKGWRYGQPFATDDSHVDAWFSEDPAPKYYVKTEELEAVVGAFYDVNEEIVLKKTEWFDMLSKDFAECPYEEPSRERFVWCVTRYIDERLFQGGAFCSKDMS